MQENVYIIKNYRCGLKYAMENIKTLKNIYSY